MQRRSTDRRSLTAPGGFTLIEMLVATTLVVLMMLLFAQIYAAAIRSLNIQQAIARNDQRMRAADQVLRSDLLRASFREVPGSRGIVPLVNGDAVHSMQKGYFYLSENEPSNPVDDVLQFTMLVSPESREHDQTSFYGRCQGRMYPNSLNNHPDEDDGILNNQVGMSRAAEISYFVRGGNLYRRVLLLRDPLLGTVEHGDQPFNSNGTIAIADEVARLSNFGSYYQRYDYAAHGLPAGSGLHFLGLSALDNYGTAGTPKPSLGLSQYRFGFNHLTGLPVEFAGTDFFGRMTHAETGSYLCVWPASVSSYEDSTPNPVTVTYPNPITSPTLAYNSATNQLSLGATVLFDDTRVNEDLLMNNIESFDVEVWDPNLDSFVQLGQGTGTAAFNTAARINSSYGPNSTAGKNWVFDTGHPGLWNDNPALSNPAFKVAYRPKFFLFSEDANHDGVLNPGEDTNGNSLFDNPNPSNPSGFWLSNFTYQSGQVVFRPNDKTLSIAYRCVRSGEDRNGNRALDAAETDSNGDNLLDPDEDVNNNGRFDVAEDLSGYGINSDSTLQYGVSGINVPSWPLVPGVQFDDGTVTWESFDNRIGLEMIRVTIRTRDTTTGNPRQFSLIHSFVEPPRGE